MTATLGGVESGLEAAVRWMAMTTAPNLRERVCLAYPYIPTIAEVDDWSRTDGCGELPEHVYRELRQLHARLTAAGDVETTVRALSSEGIVDAALAIVNLRYSVGLAQQIDAFNRGLEHAATLASVNPAPEVTP